MVRAESARVVRQAAVARRQQLHPRHRHQPARDVAGRHVRPETDRSGTRLGRRSGHEHHARVPARPAVGAGRRRLSSSRIDQFLAIAGKHQIKPMFVLFDSVLGSRTRSSASSARRRPACTTPAGCRARARTACRIRAQYPRLEAYVKGVVGAFAKDHRVLAWDVWNEPDNTNERQLRRARADEQSRSSCWRCCRKVFAWAREAKPPQPLTSGVWRGDWSTDGEADADREGSDRQVRRDHVPQLRLGRRSSKSASTGCGATTVRCSAPSTWRAATAARLRRRCRSAKKHNVAAYNWGFVQGKTQTICPGIRGRSRTSIASRRSGFTKSSAPTARRTWPEEVEFIKRMTGANNCVVRTGFTGFFKMNRMRISQDERRIL